MIDGYVGFLCLDKNEMPMVALHWEKYFQHIREKYNSIYKVQMPCITPHVCRHTFYSKMAKTGMNPKTLQYIMGHSKAVRGVENTAKSSIYGGFSVMIKILFICHGSL